MLRKNFFTTAKVKKYIELATLNSLKKDDRYQAIRNQFTNHQRIPSLKIMPCVGI